MYPHISLGGQPYAGKSTIARRLVAKWGALWVPRVTTRKLRQHEEDGLEYIYRSKSDFRRMRRRGEIIWASFEPHEHSTSREYYTGVLRKEFWPNALEHPLVSVFGAVAPRIKKTCAPEMITFFLKISKEEYEERETTRTDRVFRERRSYFLPEDVEAQFDFIVDADCSRDACITRIEEIVEEVAGIKLVG